jgi:hypothetical protein
MASCALIIPTTDLQPNPPPYGELRMNKGIWDRLQAAKAYQEPQIERDQPSKRKASLNLEI